MGLGDKNRCVIVDIMRDFIKQICPVEWGTCLSNSLKILYLLQLWIIIKLNHFLRSSEKVMPKTLNVLGFQVSIECGKNSVPDPFWLPNQTTCDLS